MTNHIDADYVGDLITCAFKSWAVRLAEATPADTADFRPSWDDVERLVAEIIHTIESTAAMPWPAQPPDCTVERKTAMRTSDIDFWNDLSNLALTLDGHNAGSRQEKIRDFLEYFQEPNPRASVEDFRRYAVHRLLSVWLAGPGFLTESEKQLRIALNIPDAKAAERAAKDADLPF